MLWGVAPPTPSATATSDVADMTVQAHAVEDSQNLYNDKHLPLILEAWGIKDWTLKLKAPQESMDAKLLALVEKRSNIAERLTKIGGFRVMLDEQGTIIWLNDATAKPAGDKESDPPKDKEDDPEKEGEEPKEDKAEQDLKKEDEENQEVKGEEEEAVTTDKKGKASLKRDKVD